MVRQGRWVRFSDDLMFFSHRTRTRLTSQLVAPLLIATAVFTASGCASTVKKESVAATAPAPKPKNKDPLEGMNRGIYKFNDSLDRHILRPVAVAYHDHTPSWFQKGVHNFYQNLFYPTTIVNQFLQGKFKQGAQDIGRFAINTTLGWGGVLDVASGATLPVHDEESGQTLGRWGVPPGPYLMLPFLGPSTLRDGPARVADTLLEPLYWYNVGDGPRWGSLVINAIDSRAGLLQADRALSQAYDPYAFMRDAYLQRRQYLVYDGNPPEDTPVEDENWDQEALKEDEAAAGGDDAAEAGSSSTGQDSPTPAQNPDGNAGSAPPGDATSNAPAGDTTSNAPTSDTIPGEPAGDAIEPPSSDQP
jgi:phospholipid-binding lipoprotein MlaA